MNTSLHLPPRRLKTFLVAAEFLPLVPFSTRLAGLNYGLYVNDGPEGWSSASGGEIAGTVGQGRKTGAFRISGFGFPAEFRTHAEGDGWHHWLPAVEGAFDRGVGKRLEAIQFRFRSGIPNDVTILARVHLQTIGWTPVTIVKDGTTLGTTGESRRLEAIQIVAASGPEFTDERQVQQAVAALENTVAHLRSGEWTEEQATETLTKGPAAIFTKECLKAVVDSVVVSKAAYEETKIAYELSKEFPLLAFLYGVAAASTSDQVLKECGLPDRNNGLDLFAFRLAG